MTMGWHPGPGRFEPFSLATNFPRCVFKWEKAGELQPVPWESESKRVRPFREQRTPNNRKLQGDRRYRTDASCQPLKTFQDVRRGQRRDPNRWQEKRNPCWCDICRKDFTVHDDEGAVELFASIKALAAHLPCRVNPKLVCESLYDLIADCRLRGGPGSPEVEFLRNVVTASLDEKAILQVSKYGYFERGSGKEKEEDYQRYRTVWFLCFLALVRPAEINPKMPSGQDRDEARRIQGVFSEAPEGPQKKIIRQLFAPNIQLAEIAKTGKVPPPVPSDKTIYAFAQTRHFKGRQRAEAMKTLGADHWFPKTPLQAYEDDPVQFSRDLYNLRAVVKKRIKQTRNTESPPAMK